MCGWFSEPAIGLHSILLLLLLFLLSSPVVCWRRKNQFEEEGEKQRQMRSDTFIFVGTRFANVSRAQSGNFANSQIFKYFGEKKVKIYYFRCLRMLFRLGYGGGFGVRLKRRFCCSANKGFGGGGGGEDGLVWFASASSKG